MKKSLEEGDTIYVLYIQYLRICMPVKHARPTYDAPLKYEYRNSVDLRAAVD